MKVAFNFHIGKGPNGDPMAVGVPWQLGLVMGTATTSFLAAPAVLNLKTRNPPTRAQLDLARISAPDGSPPRSNSGRLFSRLHSNQARWADLFRGEELTNAGAADPAKVQQFLATFMLALIYIAGMLRVLPANESKSLEFTDLPAISSGFLVLLGVSHAAYLGAKAVPQSPSSPSLAPDTAIPRVHTIAG